MQRQTELERRGRGRLRQLLQRGIGVEVELRAGGQRNVALGAGPPTLHMNLRPGGDAMEALDRALLQGQRQVDIRRRNPPLHDGVQIELAFEVEVPGQRERRQPREIELAQHHRCVDARWLCPRGVGQGAREADAAALAGENERLEHRLGRAQVDASRDREFQLVAGQLDGEVGEDQAVAILVDARVAGHAHPALRALHPGPIPPRHRRVDPHMRERPLQHQRDPRRAQIDRPHAHVVRGDGEKAVRRGELAVQRPVHGKRGRVQAAADLERGRAQAQPRIRTLHRAAQVRGQLSFPADQSDLRLRQRCQRAAHLLQMRRVDVEIEGEVFSGRRAAHLQLQPQRARGEGVDQRGAVLQVCIEVEQQRAHRIKVRRPDVQLSVQLSAHAFGIELRRALPACRELQRDLPARGRRDHSTGIDPPRGRVHRPVLIRQMGLCLDLQRARAGRERQGQPRAIVVERRLAVPAHLADEQRPRSACALARRSLARQERVHVVRFENQLAQLDCALLRRQIKAARSDDATLAQRGPQVAQHHSPKAHRALQLRVEIELDRRSSNRQPARRGQPAAQSDPRQRARGRVARLAALEIELLERERRRLAHSRPQLHAPLQKRQRVDLHRPRGRPAARLRRRVAGGDGAGERRRRLAVRPRHRGHVQRRPGQADAANPRLFPGQGQRIEAHAGLVRGQHHHALRIGERHLLQTDLEQAGGVHLLHRERARERTGRLRTDQLAEAVFAPVGLRNRPAQGEHERDQREHPADGEQRDLRGALERH